MVILIAITLVEESIVERVFRLGVADNTQDARQRFWRSKLHHDVDSEIRGNIFRL